MNTVIISKIRDEINNPNKINEHEIMPTEYTKSGMDSLQQKIIEMCGMHLSEDRQSEIRKITDRKEAIHITKEHGSFLRYLPEQFKNDKEIVNVAMQDNIYNLQFASQEIRNNAEIILNAINSKLDFSLHSNHIVFNICAGEEIKDSNLDTLQYLQKSMFNDQLEKAIPENINNIKTNKKTKI